MSTNDQVADFASETYPHYSTELHSRYIDGYVPSSFSAPHSSLLRSSTWLGMGLLMSFFPFAGTLLWGWTTMLYGTGTSANYDVLLMIIGAIGVVVSLVGSVVLIKRGRRYYNNYRKETGREF